MLYRWCIGQQIKYIYLFRTGCCNRQLLMKLRVQYESLIEERDYLFLI